VTKLKAVGRFLENRQRLLRCYIISDLVIMERFWPPQPFWGAADADYYIVSLSRSLWSLCVDGDTPAKLISRRRRRVFAMWNSLYFCCRYAAASDRVARYTGNAKWGDEAKMGSFRHTRFIFSDAAEKERERSGIQVAGNLEGWKWATCAPADFIPSFFKLP
jgi:hypothetical protein